MSDVLTSPDELADYVNARLRADRIPGLSIAVVAGAAVRWSGAFGLADLAAEVPVGQQTPYLWFSMTKIATATAVMRLVAQGRLDLARPAHVRRAPRRRQRLLRRHAPLSRPRCRRRDDGQHHSL